MQIGDKVIINIPHKKQRIGTIKGEGRTGEWWQINIDGLSAKSTTSIHKSYCLPYTEQQLTSAHVPHCTITEK